MHVSSSSNGKQGLLSSNVYISEGLDRSVISEMQALASSHPQVCLLHTFVDEKYHRTGFTLASQDSQCLSLALIRLALAAIARIDLSRHQALHPRLGSTDHISIHPLINPSEDTSLGLKLASQCALDVGQGLSASCPVYYYGSAHPQGRRLADIRRSLGYFKADVSQPQSEQWQGSASISSRSLASYPPDVGPNQADKRTGVCTVGAIPLIQNYNVPLTGCQDIKAARPIARMVSERGGGLKAVEAMALNHSHDEEGTGGGVIEIACNLLDPQLSTPSAVQSMVESLVSKAKVDGILGPSVAVGQGYLTGKTREELIKMALRKLVGEERENQMRNNQ
jgi:glutamate formiminotransferase